MLRTALGGPVALRKGGRRHPADEVGQLDTLARRASGIVNEVDRVSRAPAEPTSTPQSLSPPQKPSSTAASTSPFVRQRTDTAETAGTAHTRRQRQLSYRCMHSLQPECDARASPPHLSLFTLARTFNSLDHARQSYCACIFPPLRCDAVQPLAQHERPACQTTRGRPSFSSSASD